jgi:acyl carrier protein
MKNEYTLRNIFITLLGVEEDVLDNLKYNDVPNWDSIGHMGLISEIEDQFNIFLEVDDIIEFSSFKKGIEILKKYDVEF